MNLVNLRVATEGIFMQLELHIKEERHCKRIKFDLLEGHQCLRSIMN